MFDIFREDKSEKEFCPSSQFYPSEEAEKLIDWENFEKLDNANLDGKATVILGYWKTYMEIIKPHFVHYYVCDTKDNQKMLIQHDKNKQKDLLIFVTEYDNEKNYIKNPKDRLRGCIQIDGTLKELFTTEKDYRIKMRIKRDLSIPIDRELKAYSMNFPKTKERRKTKKK